MLFTLVIIFCAQIVKCELQNEYSIYNIDNESFITLQNATLQQITDKFHSIDFPEVDVRNFTIISDKTLPHLAQSSQIYEDYDKQCQFEDDAEGVRAIFDNAGYMTYLAYLKNVSVSASYSISCVGYYYDDQGHRHIPSQKCDEISTYATPLFLQHGFADDSCYPSNLNITEQCPDQCINNDTITLKPNNNTDLGAFIALNKSAIEAKILMLRYGTFIMTYQYSPYDFFDFTKKFDKDSSVLYAKNNSKSNIQYNSLRQTSIINKQHQQRQKRKTLKEYAQEIKDNKINNTQSSNDESLFPFVVTVYGYGERAIKQGDAGDNFWLVKGERELFTIDEKPLGTFYRVAIQDELYTNSSIDATFFARSKTLPVSGTWSIRGIQWRSNFMLTMFLTLVVLFV